MMKKFSDRKIGIISAILTVLFGLLGVTPYVYDNWLKKEPKLFLGILSDVKPNGEVEFEAKFNNEDTIRIFTCLEIRQQDLIEDVVYYVLGLPFDLGSKDRKYVDDVSYLIKAKSNREYTILEDSSYYNNRLIENVDSGIEIVPEIFREDVTIKSHITEVSFCKSLIVNEETEHPGLIDEIIYDITVLQNGQDLVNYVVKNYFFTTYEIDSVNINSPEYEFVNNDKVPKEYAYIVKAKVNTAYRHEQRDNNRKMIMQEYVSAMQVDFSNHYWYAEKEVYLLLACAMLLFYIIIDFVKKLFRIKRHKENYETFDQEHEVVLNPIKKNLRCYMSFGFVAIVILTIILIILILTIID